MTDAIESSIDRALARLAAKKDPILVCWSCKHAYPVTDGDPLKREYRCDQCGAVTAYGEPMPRVTITPYTDRRFLVLRFDQGPDKPGVDVVLARGYACELALELLSVTEPSLYAALESLFRARAVNARRAEVERAGAPLAAEEPTKAPDTAQP